MKQEREIKRFSLSKREFLEVTGFLASCAVGAGIGVVFGKGWIKWDESTEEERQSSRTKEKAEALGADPLVEEIKSYRESLGLSGLPKELHRGLQFKERWEGEAPVFEDVLPEELREYGQSIKNVMDTVFGKNATRLVRRAEINENSPDHLSFSWGPYRKCAVPINIAKQISLGDFLDVILHEAVGHGSDPQTGAKYPPEILIKVEHGKWRALSRAFSIEGQFFQHPGDVMFPIVSRETGGDIAYYFVENRLSEAIEPEDIPVVQDILTMVALDEGKDLDKIKFNKRVSRKIGVRLIEKMREAKLRLRGEAREKYELSLEKALKEIYAEMIKMAVKYPERIQNDSDIIQGCFEIISAIREESVLPEDIKNELLRQEEAVRNGEAAQFQKEVGQEEPEIETEEVQDLGALQEQFQQERSVFEQFMFGGILYQEILEQIDSHRELVSNYAKTCSRIVTRHPILMDADSASQTELFDPELHIWEIRKIEKAIDSDFIKSILEDPRTIEDNLDRIKESIRILRAFAISSAF